MPNDGGAIVSVLKRLRTFISDYAHFANPQIIRPLALWIAGTYLYDAFDSYPYLAITAKVKRAGKTRTSELVGFTCQMPYSVAGASAASLFRIIKDSKPTIIWDEAETLASEASSILRAFLNVGYRKGQTIPRATGTGVIQWPTYCPKVFVLIGDVYDTLRDRSIVITMQRGEPKKRFSYETAKAIGEEIADELKKLIAENLPAIISAYETVDVTFLTDRDEEIWRPIFALASVLDSENINELKRLAVDMSTEKTQPVRSRDMQNERAVERDEYARRLLSDLHSIMLANPKLKNGISSFDAVKLLKEIDIAPWRKYHGNSEENPANDDGLSMNTLALMLAMYQLRPKPIRGDSKKCNGNKQNVFRGYSRRDILEAVKKAGVK